jgi:hypothetical protein
VLFDTGWDHSAGGVSEAVRRSATATALRQVDAGQTAIRVTPVPGWAATTAERDSKYASRFEVVVHPPIPQARAATARRGMLTRRCIIVMAAHSCVCREFIHAVLTSQRYKIILAGGNETGIRD